MVCNRQGLCLIRTRSSRIAYWLEPKTHNLAARQTLTIGGDPGTRQPGPRPVFHQIGRR